MDNMDTTNDTQHRIDTAPLPGPRELGRRSNLLVQLFRFLSLNWTMFRLAKKHH